MRTVSTLRDVCREDTARGVGQVLGEYAEQVGDTFLCYRIRTLMAQGQV
ncbi:DUF3658 domain-containing protein, partial [Vibrio natriegens]